VEGASSCGPASKSLTVLYYNVRSILPKVDELRDNVLSQKPDILCIVETWLSEDVTNNDLTTRCTDWTIMGIAVALLCMYITICHVVLLQGGPHNLEFLAPSVTCTSVSVCSKFCICLFYHPPSSPGTTLQMVNPAKFSTFILLGDFNVNFCNPQHLLFSHVSDILYNFHWFKMFPLLHM